MDLTDIKSTEQLDLKTYSSLIERHGYCAVLKHILDSVEPAERDWIPRLMVPGPNGTKRCALITLSKVPHDLTAPDYINLAFLRWNCGAWANKLALYKNYEDSKYYLFIDNAAYTTIPIEEDDLPHIFTAFVSIDLWAGPDMIQDTDAEEFSTYYRNKVLELGPKNAILHCLDTPLYSSSFIFTGTWYPSIDNVKIDSLLFLHSPGIQLGVTKQGNNYLLVKNNQEIVIDIPTVHIIVDFLTTVAETVTVQRKLG